MARILVVDDDALMRDSLTQTLSGAGYDVGTAQNTHFCTLEYVEGRSVAELLLLDPGASLAPSPAGWTVTLPGGGSGIWRLDSSSIEAAGACGPWSVRAESRPAPARP